MQATTTTDNYQILELKIKTYMNYYSFFVLYVLFVYYQFTFKENTTKKDDMIIS